MTHWIPERLTGVPEDPRCSWIEAAPARYVEPFFETTLSRFRRERPVRETTDLDALKARGLAAPPRNPAAIIFHVSRCGSTLLSQLFAELPDTIVLSEAPILDHILRSGRADRYELFDAALRLLARPAGGAKHLIVKSDCWHVFDAAHLRALYPDTPFVLLYRAPRAVFASQLRGRGSHMVPGVLAGSGFGVAFDAATMSVDEYGARVLEQLYGAMLDVARTDYRVTPVAYEERFPSAFLRVCGVLGITLTDADRARVEARCRLHAKEPGQPFTGDPASNLPAVGLEAIEILFDQLEELRRAGEAISA